MSKTASLTPAVPRADALMEDAAPITKGGKVLDKDGNCLLAIIRPCISRGKRVRGLPPIYTPEMLAENAANFKGWPMFVDHMLSESMSEEEIEATEHIVSEIYEGAKRGRSVLSVGGRILEAWWDPTYEHPDDEKYGHERGAVMGTARPTPVIAALIEHDAEIIHVSINAQPTGFRQGERRGRRGMLIEGIRSQPQGSVDWVVRPGAGGRVVTQESEQEIVSVIESVYDAEHNPQGADVDLSQMTNAEVREYLAENRPGVLEEAADNNTGLTESDVRDIVNTALSEHSPGLAEAVRQTARTEAVSTIQIHGLHTDALKLIENAEGLGDKAKATLRGRISLDDEGSNALLAEITETIDPETGDVTQTLSEALHETIEGEIGEVREMIAEATGDPKVVGAGSGGSAGGEELSETEKDDKFNEYVDNLVEEGVADNREDAEKLAHAQLGTTPKQKEQ